MAAKRPCLQRLAIALASAGAVAALALAAAPASAQFGNFRRGGIFDSFWGPFQAPRQSTEPRVDASRAPAPQRRETPATTTVLVLGDSMADWLAYGLEDALADTPEIGVVRRHRTNSGLIRYDGRNENADWAQGTREAIAATKPKYIIMMVGLNDRQSIRVPADRNARRASGGGAELARSGRDAGARAIGCCARAAGSRGLSPL